MGALRTIGKGVGGFFFTVFLVLVIFMLAIAHFTACSTLKPIITDTLKQQFTATLATPEQLNTAHASLMDQCERTGNKTIYIQSLELECSDISTIAATDLPELMSNATFDKIYFRRYDCSFIQCFQMPGEDKFLFLMSGQANEFFEKTIIYLGVATVLSAFILIVATETWPERFKAVGINLIFVGIPYFLIPLMKGYIAQQAPQEISIKIGPMVNQIFDSVSGNLLIVLVVGIILAVVGFVFGYLNKRKKTKKK